MNHIYAAVRSLFIASMLLLTTGGGGGDAPVLPSAIVAVTPVGTPSGVAVESMVPTAGGTLTSADGRLKIEVPAGALAAATMLSIQPITNESPGGIGRAYRLGPEGTTFTAPVKLTFSYTPLDLAGTELRAMKLATQDSRARWNSIKSVTRDTTAQTITVVTTHFSDWARFSGYQLKPALAHVAKGGTVDLEVVICNTPPNADPELSELVITCRPEPEFFNIKQWTVNGIVNGSGSVGKLSPKANNTAQYTAPASAPPKNPVSVTAQATDKSGQTSLLISTIWVGVNPPLTGTITTTQKSSSAIEPTVTTEAQVTFVYDYAQDLYLVSKGIVTATWDVPPQAGCRSHLKFTGTVAHGDGQITVIDGTGYFATAASTVEFAGTSSCGPRLEPMTLTAEINWWPAAERAFFRLKPDGRLEDAFNETDSAGRNVVARWTLRPGM